MCSITFPPAPPARPNGVSGYFTYYAKLSYRERDTWRESLCISRKERRKERRKEGHLARVIIIFLPLFLFPAFD